MAKKFLRKNEFRMDNNPKHFGSNKKPHPAYISAKRGHMYKANSITHSRTTTDGLDTHIIYENPDKLSKDKRLTRISPPYWQKQEQFSKNKLSNFRFKRKTRYEIKKLNNKYYK